MVTQPDGRTRQLVCSRVLHAIPVAATQVVVRQLGDLWLACSEHERLTCDHCQGQATAGQLAVLVQEGSDHVCQRCRAARDPSSFGPPVNARWHHNRHADRGLEGPADTTG